MQVLALHPGRRRLARAISLVLICSAPLTCHCAFDQDEKPSPLVQGLLDEAAKSADPKDALPKLKSAEDEARRLKDSAGEAAALLSEGRCYAALQQYEPGVKAVDRAIRIEVESGDRRGRAAAVLGKGRLLIASVRSADALACCREAVHLFSTLPKPIRGSDIRGLATSFYGVAVSDGDLQHLSEAIAAYQLCDRTLGRLGGQEMQPNDYLLLSRSSHNMAAHYEAIGRREQAFQIFQQSLDAAQRSGNKGGEAETDLRIGNLYKDFGQPARAIECYERAFEIDEKFHVAPDAASRNNLANVYRSIHEFDKAEPLFKEALEFERAIVADPNYKSIFDDKPMLALTGTLHDLGVLYSQTNRAGEAMRCFKEALGVERQMFYRAAEAETLNSIGSLDADSGKPQGAIDNFMQALPISRVKGTNTEAETLESLARANAESNPRLSVWLAKESLARFQAERTEVSGLGPSVKRSMAESMDRAFTFAAFQLAKQNRVPEALAILAAAKNDSLSAQMPETSQEREWSAAYSREMEGLASCIDREQSARSAGKPAIGQLRATEQELRARKQKLAAVMANCSVKARASGRGLKDTDALMNLHRNMGRDKSAAAVLVLEGEREVLLVVARSNKVTVRHMPLPKDYAETVGRFKTALADPFASVDPRPDGLRLYRALIKPIENDLRGVTSVAWCMRGSCSRLPVSALWDGKRYIVERWDGSLFEPSSHRSSWAASVQSSALIACVNDAHAVSDPVTHATLRFLPLVNAPAEMRAVAGSFRRPKLLNAGSYSRTSLRRALMNPPAVIHLIGHFRSFPGDDRRSLLLCGDGSTLSLEDFKSIPDGSLDKVSLVVLSACSTAQGEAADGADAESLGSWFQRKGAHQVVSALWPVDDSSTSHLMASFYQSQRQGRVGAAKSLRAAQLHLLHERAGAAGAHRSEPVGTTASGLPFKPDPKAPFAHPHYWAPFVLMRG